MKHKPHMCPNPCAKGRAGGCTGACAAKLLGFDTEARTLRAKIGGKPPMPATGPEDKEPAA